MSRQTLAMKPLVTLRLELNAPATPALVMQIGKLFQDALEATGEPLADESVTMVIGNLKASAELRGRDTEGAKAVTSITEVIQDPVRALQASPHARFIAEAISESAGPLKRLGGRFLKGRKVVARFDETLIGAMRGASADSHQGAAFRGQDQIYTPVLRVGRSVDDGPVKARIHIHNAIRDVEVAGSEEAFHAALKSRRMQRVDIETEWVKQPDGSLLMNLRKTRALATTDFYPLSGREFLDDFSDALDPDAAEAFMASVESEL